MLIWTGGVLFAVAGAVLWVLGALLDRSGRIRLRHWAEEAGGLLLDLYRHPVALHVFRTSLTLAAVASFLSLSVELPLSRPWGALAALGVLAVAEIASRVIVRRAAEETLRALTFAYRAAAWALAPILWVTGRLTREGDGELPLAGGDDDEEDEASDDEIEAFLEVGAVEGILEPGEGELMMRVIDFGDTLVKSVVTPRMDVVAAPETTGLEDLAQLFIDSRHSRIPLYRDSLDQVVGILHIRDVLKALRSEVRERPGDLAGEPFFVPDSKPVAELLEAMQARRQQMAIVVDEFGGTMGLVTVEDLLEELVGEIADEHEVLPNEMEPAGRGRWRLDGGAEIEVLSRLFQAEVDDEPYETVGGMVFGLLGDVPRVGDQVRRRGVALEVESVVGRRVGTLLAWRPGDLSAEDEE